MSSTQKFNVKYVCNRTGLTAHTIRAWEKRYGAVIPERTEKNRRIYSEDDIEKLQLLHRLILAGHSIGQIAGLPLESLKDLLRKDSDLFLPTPEMSKRTQSDFAEKLVSEAIQHVASFDGEKLENVMHRALTGLGRRTLTEKFLAPFLEKQGEMWSAGTLRIAQEHFASSIVRGFLANLYRQSGSSRTDRALLIATPAGQHHEFGALFVAIESIACGWRSFYMGPNLPAEEIAEAAILNRVPAIALSIIYPANDPNLPAELLLLRRCLPPDIQIVAGGRSASGYKNSLEAIGSVVLNDIRDLDRFLEQPNEVTNGPMP